MTLNDSTADASYLAPLEAIAGLWRRFAALALDALVLGAIGFALGGFAFDTLARLGPWGRLVGFAIAVAYFGILNSAVARGQTLGKMAFKIRVVARNGGLLPLPASLLRSAILCVPYFLNHLALASPPDTWVQVLISFLLFGVGLSLVYLFFFNRRTRQSLHDLAVGSFVVKAAAPSSPLARRPLWQGHHIVVGALCVLSLLLPLLASRLLNNERFAPLLSLQQALQKEPGVRFVGVFSGVTVVTSARTGEHSTTTLSTNVMADSRDVDLEALADRLARFEIEHFADASMKDIVIVSAAYGYDIGISSASRSWRGALAPDDWRKRWANKPAG